MKVLISSWAILFATHAAAFAPMSKQPPQTASSTLLLAKKRRQKSAPSNSDTYSAAPPSDVNLAPPLPAPPVPESTSSSLATATAEAPIAEEAAPPTTEEPTATTTPTNSRRQSQHFSALQDMQPPIPKLNKVPGLGLAYESDFAMSSVGLGGSGTYNQEWLTTPARTSASLDDCMMTVDSEASATVVAAAASAHPAQEVAVAPVETAVAPVEAAAPAPATTTTAISTSNQLRKSQHFSSLEAVREVTKEPVAVEATTTTTTTATTMPHGSMQESDFATSSVGLGGSGTYSNGWLTTPARTSANLDDCMMTIATAFDGTTAATTVVQKVLARTTESDFATSSVGLGGSGTYNQAWLQTPARLSANLDDCMMTIFAAPSMALSSINATEQDHQELVQTVMMAKESNFATSSVGLGGSGTYSQAWLTTPARLSANLEDCMMEIGGSDGIASATSNTTTTAAVPQMKESEFALSSVGLGGSGTYNQAWLNTPARLSANLEDCMMLA